MSDDLLTVREVARACGRSEETVRRWIWSGKLRARKLGNQLFVEQRDVEAIPAPRAAEAAPQYSTRRRGTEIAQEGGSAPAGFGQVGPMTSSTANLFRDYAYSPVVEDLRQHRGQILPSPEQELANLMDDEEFQEEVLSKFGPTDVLELLRQVREA